MVKHIHIQIDDDTHKEFTNKKQTKTWEEVLEKGINEIEG